VAKCFSHNLNLGGEVGGSGSGAGEHGRSIVNYNDTGNSTDEREGRSEVGEPRCRSSSGNADFDGCCGCLLKLCFMPSRDSDANRVLYSPEASGGGEGRFLASSANQWSFKKVHVGVGVPKTAGDGKDSWERVIDGDCYLMCKH
jgi:hypothetical protein